MTVSSEIFKFTYEVSRGADGDTLDLAVQITELLVDVLVGFQMTVEVLTWDDSVEENDVPQASAVCEAYLASGSPAMEMGETTLSTGYKPLLTPGATVLFRNVPGSKDQVPEEFLARAVRFIEGCCSLDKRAIERKKNTKAVEELNGVLKDVLDMVDASERLLKRNRTCPITVEFSRESFSGFVILVAATRAAVVDLVIHDYQLASATLLIAPSKVDVWRAFEKGSKAGEHG